MSKEKNLTYVAASGDPATKDVHEWLGIINGAFYTGPAIDRLHEFEKLGMEPYQIKGRLEAADEYRKEIEDNNFYINTLEIDNSSLRTKNEELRANVNRRDRVIDDQNSYIRELKEKIKNQDAVIEQLRVMNQRQYDNIAELHKEIDEREKVAWASYGEIGQLSELVRLQRNAIDGYVESNADLRKKLSRSVESNKALQKQIEFYQDKLDRVVYLIKEEE